MDNLIYILFMCLSIPLFLMMLLVEKRARLPIIFVLVGMFVAVFSSDLSALIISMLDMGMSEATITVTPITEELLKALPILFFAIVVSDRKETLFTASMATGIGFALLENSYYLITNVQDFPIITAIIRGFGTGLMHGMCTLVVGFGISFIKKKKKLFFAGIFALLSTAITYHAIFNMLVISDYYMIGAIIPIITYMPFLVWRNMKKKARKIEK